jgi:molybdopterin converting factor small subunit
VRECSVELLGLAQLVAGRKEVVVAVGAAATLGEVLDRLAEACPALVGPVLRPDRGGLVDGYICSVNGRAFRTDPATRIAPGTRIVLLASAAGG